MAAMEGVSTLPEDQPLPSDAPQQSTSAAVINLEPVDSSVATDSSDIELALTMSWKGQKSTVTVYSSDAVGDLKALLFSLTSVPPGRQKIIGLVKGKLPADETLLGELGLKPKGHLISLIGTPEGEELKEMAMMGDILDDMDLDYRGAQVAALHLANNKRTKRKLKEVVDKLEKIDLIRPLRPGKKLLVLDLDQCILDTKLWKEPGFRTADFARPYLHQLLAAVSPHYDMCIWSATKWTWLEDKLVELEMIGPTARGDYPICFVLSREQMFSVYSERKGQPYKHEVKALEVIWTKLPQFNATNTIHIDDLSRNFALNLPNGLKVPAYKDAKTTRRTDKELIYITRYLLQLSLVPDLSPYDHSKYRRGDLPLPEGAEDPVRATGLE